MKGANPDGQQIHQCLVLELLGSRDMRDTTAPFVDYTV
jgi:hypothetical protein